MYYAINVKFMTSLQSDIIYSYFSFLSWLEGCPCCV